MSLQMFRVLNEEEIKSFKDWATNNQEEANADKIGLYHPIVINTWVDLKLLPEDCRQEIPG